jgi:hypothetical protein
MEKTDSYFDWLGYKVRDVVSGFEGIAESLCFDLYGCVQVAIRPKYREGMAKEEYYASWYDVKRLELVSSERVLEPPAWGMPGTEDGPAEKAPY